ncbi:MAG: hypothetical protein ABSG88_11330 [Bradyrhizobium sp.]
MADPRPPFADFATIVSKISYSIQLDRPLLAGLRPAGRSTIGKRAAILEKLEEAAWFTVTHVRTEHGAYRNLTEIKVFGAGLSFNYGSTAIVETL